MNYFASLRILFVRDAGNKITVMYRGSTVHRSDLFYEVFCLLQIESEYGLK